MDSYEIINYISNSVKKTPAKIYIKGNLAGINFSELEYYGNDFFGVLFCEKSKFERFYDANKGNIESNWAGIFSRLRPKNRLQESLRKDPIRG